MGHPSLCFELNLLVLSYDIGNFFVDSMNTLDSVAS